MPVIESKGGLSSQGFGEFAKAGGAATYIEDVFSTYLYTGNGSTQTITNGIDLAGNGGLVWIKNRGADELHQWWTTVLGNQSYLRSNGTEGLFNSGSTAITYNSNGFSLNTNSTANNASANTYFGGTFREQPKFFDVVTYTGTGSNLTVNHNLGSAPGCIIIKDTSNAYNWTVYHRSLATGEYLVLNSTGAKVSTGGDNVIWNVTSTSFNVASYYGLSYSGDGYVAYLFAHDAGGFGLTGTDNVISCGSYTGNGSATGPTITLGYEPQWMMVKAASTTGNWVIEDVMRGMSQTASNELFPNLANAETALNPGIIPNATGFSLGTTNADMNSNGVTYIYIAIRRPNKPPTTGTQVYNAVARTGTGAAATVTGVGFAPDLFLSGDRSTGNAPSIFVDKLRGVNKELAGWSTIAEYAATGGVTGFENNSVTLGANTDSLGVNVSGRNYIEWMFRRAPGFFDVATWTGTGAARTVSHNLVAVPELIIGKCINYPQEWYVYSAATGNSYSLQLQSNAAAVFAGIWNYQNPTVSSIYLASPGDGGALNVSSRTYIGYLFASLQGISKVGNYTGNGASQTINCGFTTGARFILIKRTDSAGDWYVWDSARGIVAGNDPYLLLNSTAAEVTSTDYIDTYSAGFEISSTAPAAINANGGSFIFLAIA